MIKGAHTAVSHHLMSLWIDDMKYLFGIWNICSTMNNNTSMEALRGKWEKVLVILSQFFLLSYKNRKWKTGSVLLLPFVSSSLNFTSSLASLLHVLSFCGIFYLCAKMFFNRFFLKMKLKKEENGLLEFSCIFLSCLSGLPQILPSTKEKNMQHPPSLHVLP